MNRVYGEGTIFKTIQKFKRGKFLDKECAICNNCNDRTLCNGRTGYEKCQKCKDCKEECLIYCDRFRCYERVIAQVYANKKQITVGTGKKTKEVNKKKTENLSKIANGKYVDKNKITLSQQMKTTMQYNLQNELIGENTYHRNMESIKAIERKTPEIADKRIQELTVDDILKILRKNKDNSQSVIEKAYDIINASLKKAVKDKLIEEENNPIKKLDRNAILSNKDRKRAIPFTIPETQKLLEYINENDNNLTDVKSAIDSVSIKNLIKLSLAFGTRCGELCALNIDKHIDFVKKKIIVERTLTRNKNNQIVMGKYTKTGRKARKRGNKDTRNIPFDTIYPSNEIEKIIKEQINIAENIEGNSERLLFCNKDGSYIDIKHVTCIIKRICREAGIKLDLVTGCHIHMTKHTVVTRLIEFGMNIYAISKLVGTSREVLEKTYAHILDDFVEKEIEKTRENKNREGLSTITKESENERPVSNIIPFRRLG